MFKKFLLAGTGITITLSLIACQSDNGITTTPNELPEFDEGVFHVQGYVTDAGTPLEGVQVNIQVNFLGDGWCTVKTAYTTNMGHFLCYDCEPAQESSRVEYIHATKGTRYSDDFGEWYPQPGQMYWKSYDYADVAEPLS